MPMTATTNMSSIIVKPCSRRLTAAPCCNGDAGEWAQAYPGLGLVPRSTCQKLSPDSRRAANLRHFALARIALQRVSARDSQLHQPVTQATEGDAEEPRRVLAHAAALLERALHHLAL